MSIYCSLFRGPDISLTPLRKSGLAAMLQVVEAGFVRILSNPAFSALAVSPIEATEALGISTKHPSHQFWPDDISLAGGLTNLQDRIGAINKSRTRICWPLRFITMGGWQR